MSEIEDIVANDYRVLDLVRLSIASEYHKRGLKREDIVDKVCSTMRKVPVFNKVLELANAYLEDNFAYNLVPMPVVTATVNVAAKTNQARKAAVNQANKIANSKTGPPQFYALVSTFTHEQRAGIPTNSRDPVRLAIIQAILMIIKLSGNVIDHSQLVKALNEIQMCRTDTPELPQKDLEPFLEQLKKEKYILKDRKNIMDAESIYSWGPRAFLEFPPTNMADFLHTVASTNNKDELEPKFKEKVIRVLAQE